MVRMIMEMVGNHSFTLTAGNGKWSTLRRLKNGIPQGSVLAPLLFNIYISDLPTLVSRKYSYADDLEIMHAGGDWPAVEGGLSKDMATIGEYLQTWKLKLSTTKTVSAAFHLNNKEAKRELRSQFQQRNPALPLRVQIPRSNIGQVAHVSPTPWVTSQEANRTRRAPEAACWLGFGCWNNNVANSHPSPGAFNCRVLCSCLVPQCSYPPRRIGHLWCLENCLRPTPVDNLP